MRMFHAACAASQRPALSPTRGSGDGAVADTIGATGGGITAGAGGGGGGGVPRPAAAGGAIVSGGPAGAAPGDGAAAGVGALGGGVAAGVGVLGAGAAAGGGALGVAAGGAPFDPELAHAGTITAAAASNIATSSASISSERVCLIALIGDSPAFRSSG
jgi:hypothetical protein